MKKMSFVIAIVASALLAAGACKKKDTAPATTPAPAEGSAMGSDMGSGMGSDMGSGMGSGSAQ
jgi:hypothetical protein